VNELKKLAKRLTKLREALAAAGRNGAPEPLLRLSSESVLAWLQGEGPDHWIERLNVHSAQIEYLLGEGLWPWGEDIDLDRHLATGCDTKRDLADGAKTESPVPVNSLAGPTPRRHRRQTLPARARHVSVVEGKTSKPHLDFEQLFQVIETIVRQVRLEFVRVVLASPEGDVRFVEVPGNRGFRAELQNSLREGFLPLGMLGWEMTGDTLQAKRMLFAWHNDDEKLRELFRYLCEDAANQVREALDEARVIESRLGHLQ
jgi:hypothetical protein